MVGFTVEVASFSPSSVHHQFLRARFFSPVTNQDTNHQQFFCAQKNKIQTNVNRLEQTECAKNMATNTNTSTKGTNTLKVSYKHLELNKKTE